MPLASTQVAFQLNRLSNFQETLRFDTVVPHLFREATRDEVVPLSKEVRCKSGNVIGELHIPKGTHIIISDVAYNM